ncbi:hypothetical protein ASPWEDRAFT_119865 [Aspergillus wentii DTO 134E9]|uniref:Uncharacterized protein n=1 Tax=Aspergillus wentii DTO 134E9 TaxID=1073089 RepID=A0A1L9R7U5_ASPWE|nr:uncharacterized protein ASPWEDRAFT_119865 [Aspergillus wentii DTO 134E9]OJJ30958.1 hypothetical protein ASPWEDRAFT_119865 [Aspergillus wentii DTO 134E9]
MRPVDYAVGYNNPRDVRSSEKRRVVELLLDSKADITTRKGREAWSALGVAISAGSVEMVKLLLDRGGDIEQGPMLLPPLCFAASESQEGVVQLLIGRGVSLQETDKHYGRNALSWAAARGNEAVFDRLLKAPAIGWDDADWLGRTPIFYTIITGNKGFFKRLMSRGSDVHRRDRFGLTPLFLAVQRGHEDLVRHILSSRPLEEEPRDRYGRSLTWWMQNTGNTRLRDPLVQCGMQLEASWGGQHPTLRRSKGSCDVCTLNITCYSQSITSGSGREGYKICSVCCKFGAGRADFAGV